MKSIALGMLRGNRKGAERLDETAGKPVRREKPLDVLQVLRAACAEEERALLWAARLSAIDIERMLGISEERRLRRSRNPSRAVKKSR